MQEEHKKNLPTGLPLSHGQELLLQVMSPPLQVPAGKGAHCMDSNERRLLSHLVARSRVRRSESSSNCVR